MVVKFFAFFRDYTHTKETTVDGCETVKELVQKLCDMYGAKFGEKIYKDQALTSEVIILVNGRHITHYDGIDTKLSKDDEISIFPVVAGG